MGKDLGDSKALDLWVELESSQTLVVQRMDGE